MKELILDFYQSKARIYTHTFIYHDVPNLIDNINRDVGDRRNSSRTVLAPSTAFGFVLDDTGLCLASTKLTIAGEN